MINLKMAKYCPGQLLPGSTGSRQLALVAGLAALHETLVQDHDVAHQAHEVVFRHGPGILAGVAGLEVHPAIAGTPLAAAQSRGASLLVAHFNEVAQGLAEARPDALVQVEALGTSTGLAGLVRPVLAMTHPGRRSGRSARTHPVAGVHDLRAGLAARRARTSVNRHIVGQMNGVSAGQSRGVSGGQTPRAVLAELAQHDAQPGHAAAPQSPVVVYIHRIGGLLARVLGLAVMARHGVPALPCGSQSPHRLLLVQRRLQRRQLPVQYSL